MISPVGFHIMLEGFDYMVCTRSGEFGMDGPAIAGRLRLSAWIASFACWVSFDS